MFSEVVTLLSEVETIDEYGDIVKTYNEREVFARMDRVYLSETLQAMAQGLERQFRFTLSDYFDYEDEEELLYEGKKYKIINVQRIGTRLELNCTGGIENGNK